MKLLDLETFKNVVAHTPLISIDLIVENSEGKILLGRRTNEPAKGYWFVPGGRIYKDERLSEAFERITQAELGSIYAMEDAEFLGVYEHFYDNSFADAKISTHYVVLGYRLVTDFTLDDLPSSQHAAYRLYDEQALLQDSKVHRHTKLYFL